MAVVLWQSGSLSLSMTGKQHICRPNANMVTVDTRPPWLSRIRRRSRRGRRSSNAGFGCLSTALCSPSPIPNIQILDIIHNKVLIAAAASAAIGQCSKPFTSRILYGHLNLDFRSAFRPGGFPSTHSSAAVATATALGLERGLTDSIFGLAVVYACLIMYDAQGVRREVGSHAKVINKVLFRIKVDKDSSSTTSTSTDDDDDSKKELPSSKSETKGWKSFDHDQPRLGNASASLLLKSDAKTQSAAFEGSVVKGGGGPNKTTPFGVPILKESVGHTEIEVIAGALLGFFVSVAFCTLMQ